MLPFFLSFLFVSKFIYLSIYLSVYLFSKKYSYNNRIVDVTDLDNELLCNLGVNKAFDLRSDIEFNVRESSNVTFPTNQTLVVSRTPIFKMEDYSPIALATRWGCYAEGPKGFANGLFYFLFVLFLSHSNFDFYFSIYDNS